jgi:hypothetical protein
VPGKSTYLITVLQGQTTSMLHGVPKGATCEETLKALEESFGDQHLAAAYCSQLKTRTQGVRESLQEFVTAIEQHAHHPYPALPVRVLNASYCNQKLTKGIQ